MTRTVTLPITDRENILKEVGGKQAYLDKALSWGKSADDVGDPIIKKLAMAILYYDWARFEWEFPDLFDGSLKGKKFRDLEVSQQQDIEEKIDSLLEALQTSLLNASEQKEAKKSTLHLQIEDWIQFDQQKLTRREVNFSLVANPTVMSRDGHRRVLDFLLRLESKSHIAEAGILLWEEGDEIPSEMMDRLRLLIDDRSLKSFLVISNFRRSSAWLDRHNMQCYTFEDVVYLIKINHVYDGKIPESSDRKVPPFKFHGGDQIAQSIFNTFLKPIPLDVTTRNYLKELFRLEIEIGIWVIAIVFDSLQLDWNAFRDQIFIEIQQHSPKSSVLRLLATKK